MNELNEWIARAGQLVKMNERVSSYITMHKASLFSNLFSWNLCDNETLWVCVGVCPYTHGVAPVKPLEECGVDRSTLVA